MYNLPTLNNDNLRTWAMQLIEQTDYQLSHIGSSNLDAETTAELEAVKTMLSEHAKSLSEQAKSLSEQATALADLTSSYNMLVSGLNTKIRNLAHPIEDVVSWEVADDAAGVKAKYGGTWLYVGSVSIGMGKIYFYRRTA